MAAAAPAVPATAESWCHVCEARVQAERDAAGELQCSLCHQSYVEEISDAAQSSSAAPTSASAPPPPLPFPPQPVPAPPVAMFPPFLPFGFPFPMPPFPFPVFPGSAPPDGFFSTPGDYAMDGQHFTSILHSLLTGAAAASSSPEHRPTPEAVLQAMQRRVVQASDSSSTDSQAECVICQADVAAGDELLTLSGCRHQFHTSCIEPWLRQHSICPTCRRPVYATAT